MTTRSTMKSYAKTVQIGYEVSASVDFKDSAGNAIECNYFSVDCRSDDSHDNGFFLVQPSGVYDVEIDGLTAANTASAGGETRATYPGHTGAGVGGVIGTADGSVEMSLAAADKTLGIIVFNKLLGTTGGTKAVFVVTYGNMKQANPRRDQDDTFYPPGS